MLGTAFTLVLAAGCSTDDWCARFNLDCEEGAPERVEAVDADGDVWSELEDCDDNDPTVYPFANESWYDDIDQDCDGESDWDADGDGYDAWWRTDIVGEDCDDGDATVNPDAAEIWYDGRDQNCNDDDEHPYADYDADGDGQGSAYYGFEDCDDTNPDIYYGAQEIWYDGIDQDCNSSTEYDVDGDGYPSADHGGTDCDDHALLVNPGITEMCDGRDNNCDGDVDDDGVCDSSMRIATVITTVGSTEAFWSPPVLGNIGDNDGDSVPELVISSQTTSAGSAWLLPMDGSAEVHLDDAVAVLRGTDPSRYLGTAMVAGHDLNDDGDDDLVISGLNSEDETWNNDGVIWVMLGPLPAESTNAEPDGAIIGSAPAALFARQMLAPGDLTGDGEENLLALTERLDSGAFPGLESPAWLVLPAAVEGTVIADEVALAAFDTDGDRDGLPDTTINQTDPIAVGDVNGDGVQDVVLGLPYSRVAGGVAVLYGPAETRSASDADVMLRRAGDNVLAGWSVAVPGDVDQDGTSDIALGALVAGDSSNGAIFIENDLPEGISVLRGSHSRIDGPANENIGASMTAPGDVNDDGVPDLMSSGEYHQVWLVSGAESGTRTLDATQAALPSWVPWAGYPARAKAIGDIDGDGRSEIAVSLFPSWAVALVLDGAGWSAR
jgi:hypothetical protein